MDFGPFGGDIHSRMLSDANAAPTSAPEGESGGAEGAAAVGGSQSGGGAELCFTQSSLK